VDNTNENNRIKLRDLLISKTKNELIHICRILVIPGYSKLKKAELIDCIIPVLSGVENFKETMEVISNDEWETFCMAASTDRLVTSDLPGTKYVFLDTMGFVNVSFDGVYTVIEVPEEILKAYHISLKEGFAETKATFELMYQYAEAAANLYGIISISDLLGIFTDQNKYTKDYSYFVNSLRIREIGSHYRVWRDYLLCYEFDEDDPTEIVRTILNRAKEVSRYIPEKDELLRYSEWRYYEKNDSILAVAELLKKDFNLSDSKRDELIDSIHYAIITGDGMDDIMYGILPEKEWTNSLRKTFAGHITTIWNNTRTWFGSAHMPIEIGQMRNADKPLKKVKIGRNDPCPCGSGKKYKKCCGMAQK